MCCRDAGPGFCLIAVWRRTAQDWRGADRRPSDGKIKAAHCCPVGRGRNEAISAPWRNVHFDPRCAISEKPGKINIDPHIARRGHSQRLAFAQRCKGHGTMTAWRAVAGPPQPRQGSRCARTGSAGSQPLTGLHRSGPLAAMRSWPHVSKIAPVATNVEVAA
jgi:hypothetical protein